MIQINSTLHTPGGVTISTGSVVDVKPFFIEPQKIYVDDVFDKLRYDISFDISIYKNLTEYKRKGSIVLLRDPIEEFNIAFYAMDVDIKALTSVDGLLTLLQSHIENGDDKYPGVGSGKTSIVYPTSDL